MNIHHILFFVYFHCYVLKADFTNSHSRYSLDLIYHNDNQNEKPNNPVECTTILHEFADYASNFTKCSINHANPVNICMKCIDNYVNFTNKFDELRTKVVNGTSCMSLYISHDRLDIVLQYFDNILDVWEKGHCNACFDWSQHKPKESNNTEKFKIMHTETMQCIKENLNSTSNNTEEVCHNCYTAYVQLDEFYKTLSTDSIGVDSVCMDIVDSMNATRFIWSKVLNCCHLRRTPEIIFLCCTAIIAMLPLLFYVAVRFCGPIRDLPNVLKQSRFKQMILRSTDGSVN